MNAILVLTCVVILVGVLTGFLVGCYVGRNRYQARRGAPLLAVGVGGWIAFTLCMATGVKLATLLSAQIGWFKVGGVSAAALLVGCAWAMIAVGSASR
jgi:hypothetical protein